MEVAGEKGVTATAPETRPRVRGLAIVRLRARSPAVAGIRETRGSVYPPSPPAPSPPRPIYGRLFPGSAMRMYNATKIRRYARITGSTRPVVPRGRR